MRVLILLTFIILGVFPCLLLAPIWVIAFFVGFASMISPQAEWQDVIIFLFAPAGLFGTIFFLLTIADYGNSQHWNKGNYITGIYGLSGALIAIYMDNYQLEHFSEEPTIISYLCPYPIFALVVAYLTRHKKQKLIKTEL